MKALLQQSDDLAVSGDSHVRQCTVTNNILVDFYAKTSQVGKAEKWLEEWIQMYLNGNEHVKPDIISYNSMLQASSQSHEKGSSDKA